HRVAARIRVLRADQREDRAFGARALDAVERVVRIVAGVVLGAGRDHGAVDARGDTGRLEALVHTAQERAVAVEREPEARVRMVAVARAGRARGSFEDARDLVSRQTELAVAGCRQRVELAKRTTSSD